MSREFREWQPHAGWLCPPSPRDWLPEDHLVYCLLEVTAPSDISPIVDDRDNGGQPPCYRRMMLVLLLSADRVGGFSSRKIMQRCATDAASRIIVGGDIPDFRRIAEFRARHLKHLRALFLEVLVLCQESGLLKVGRLSLDGTKTKANASQNKAMSYDRMGPEADRLQQEIVALLARAAGADTDDDGHFDDLAGDDIPDGLKRRETRLAKILEAKPALEEAARQKASDHVGDREVEGRRHRTNPDAAVPDPKAQRKFTDPESKIMKTSNKGFDQCGNAQAVGSEQQIIVAADVTDQANDVRQTVPMTDQATDNLDDAGVTENIGAFTADTGYFSEENMNALDANGRIDNVFIATGRQKHNDKVPDSPRGRPPKNLTAKQKMARRNRTKKGRAEYARRKVIIEPVFGQIKAGQGFRNFFLRGLEKMPGEWQLVCLTHTLRKLFRSGALATGSNRCQGVERPDFRAHVTLRTCVFTPSSTPGTSDHQPRRSATRTSEIPDRTSPANQPLSRQPASPDISFFRCGRGILLGRGGGRRAAPVCRDGRGRRVADGVLGHGNRTLVATRDGCVTYDGRHLSRMDFRSIRPGNKL